MRTASVILAWAGVAGLAGAAFMAARWLLNRYDSLGRAKPFPWIAVTGLVAIAAAGLVPFFLRMRLESRLADAASAVAGRSVDVHCQAFGEAFVDAGLELGYVRFGADGAPEPSTLIKRRQCADLSDYIGGASSDFEREHVVAVHTLTHEAIHMSGVADEAETECLAVQHDAQMARLLGAAELDARRLASYYWAMVYPALPDGYRSEECRPGGALDRNLPDAPWDGAP